MAPVPPPARSSRNKILASLKPAIYQSVFSKLELVSLAQGDVVYEADGSINFVYFPETAVFSMLSSMEDGKTVEVGPVGDEGLVGVRVFLGADTSTDQVIVHVAGKAMRLRASELKAAVAGVGEISDKLVRYTQMLLAMTARSSACNKFHTVDQQFARWLLTMADYVGAELALTHELIALTLGVRRAGVTAAATGFRNQGVIDYRRGRIHIVDRSRLATIACECYAVIKNEYDLLYADLTDPQQNTF